MLQISFWSISLLGHSSVELYLSLYFSRIALIIFDIPCWDHRSQSHQFRSDSSCLRVAALKADFISYFQIPLRLRITTQATGRLKSYRAPCSLNHSFVAMAAKARNRTATNHCHSHHCRPTPVTDLDNDG